MNVKYNILLINMKMCYASSLEQQYHKRKYAQMFYKKKNIKQTTFLFQLHHTNRFCELGHNKSIKKAEQRKLFTKEYKFVQQKSQDPFCGGNFGISLIRFLYNYKNKNKVVVFVRKIHNHLSLYLYVPCFLQTA